MPTCTSTRCNSTEVRLYAEPYCDQHVPAKHREYVADLEKRARKTLNGKGWPYGLNNDIAAREYLLTWAERHGLKLATPSCQGLHWLQRGRCGVRECHRLGDWMDHVTHWTRNGKPALLLAQPYGLDLAELTEHATGDDLRVHVSTSWYGHGTVAVKVWRTDAYEAYRSEGEVR